MSAQAKVTSLDALESLRASIIVFSSRAQSIVDQVTDEIRRTRSWVQQEKRRHWDLEVKRRDRVLAQAKQELLSAKLVGTLDNLSAQQATVRKAREALEEAELKLRQVKRWMRDFDHAAEPLAKALDSFRSMLAHDLPQGTAFLRQAQITLADYAGMRMPGRAPEPAAADGKLPEGEAI